MVKCVSVVITMWICSACQRTPPAAPAVAAPDLTPIVAHVGAVELYPDDGEPVGMTIAGYQQKFADYKQRFADFKRTNPRATGTVTVEHFPPELSPSALAGANVLTGHDNVSWVVDGDAQRGYTLIYDENANGDLRDDAQHAFVAHGETFDLTIETSFVMAGTGRTVPVYQRFRRRGDRLFVQTEPIRRGTITVGGRARPFILLASAGEYNFPSAVLVFDINGDGIAGPLDLEGESPEVFRVFEHTLTIGDRSYDFATDAQGSTLTLTPRAEHTPPRRTFAVGAPAPELAGTDLDGQPIALSSLRGHTVLIDFWASSCPPCREALPKLADLYRRRHPEGLEILSIIGGDHDDAVKLLGVRPYPGHEVFDSTTFDSAALSFSYRVVSYPTYFIVAPDGKIACSRCQLDDVLARLDRAP